MFFRLFVRNGGEDSRLVAPGSAGSKRPEPSDVVEVDLVVVGAGDGDESAPMDVNRGCSYDDVVAFVGRTPLPKLGRQLLKIYFSGIVARQSIDLDEARELWAELPLNDRDGPRRIPGHPAFVMVGTK